MTSLLITHPDLSFYGGVELVGTEFCQYLADHVDGLVIVKDACFEIIKRVS